MSDNPKFKPVSEDEGMDALEAAGAYPEIPPLPPNSCVLAVRPGPDKVHTLLRLTFNVTHLNEDAQKLLAFMLSEALTAIEKHVRDMNRIEVAAKLAHRERVQHPKGNGTDDVSTPA